MTGDGFYIFDTIEVQLDPPISDFYESFNAMSWTVTLFDGLRAQLSNVLSPVIEPNPQVRSVGQQCCMCNNFLYFKWLNGELYW